MYNVQYSIALPFRALELIILTIKVCGGRVIKRYVRGSSTTWRIYIRGTTARVEKLDFTTIYVITWSCPALPRLPGVRFRVVPARLCMIRVGEERGVTSSAHVLCPVHSHPLPRASLGCARTIRLLYVHSCRSRCAHVLPTSVMRAPKMAAPTSSLWSPPNKLRACVRACARSECSPHKIKSETDDGCGGRWMCTCVRLVRP